eukprot:TRINITY_DN1839_c0_g1_i1.p1 TRINITY_DN1839_c0_g1~~TRINITY_DN1839_c0_g1_i1.p1  ORF type:complete len:645 (+),score=114.50 TRINITY_DN1839_c0_g1_i1:2-1936(+)
MAVVKSVVCALFLQAAALADPWHCDSLDPSICGYPFPNNFFKDDTTGFLNLTIDTFPKTKNNNSIDPNVGGWNTLDGFSPIPSIITYFQDLDDSKLPHFWDIAQSLSPASHTMLLNADTGDIIPHWIEMDHSADPENPEGYKRSIIMWPAHRLNDSATYIVAYRNLQTFAGSPVLASPAFAALRDSLPSDDVTVNARRGKFESIFAKLQSAGFSRQDLTLAWDFTVSSTKTQTSRMVTIRDDAFERVSGGIPFKITSVQDSPRRGVARELHGEMTVPWYLTQYAPGMSVRLNIAQDNPNLPLYNGDGLVTFTVIIPESLRNASNLGALMSYGHGLFGSQSEIETQYLCDEANEYGYVIVAVNWLGMCYEDEVVAASIVGEDLTDFAAIPDRSHQGMLNALLMMRLAASEAFYKSEHMLFDGRVVVDPSKRYYYGNSQGGIFGSVYMSLSTDVERGVLGVAGGPYSLLLPRSADFTPLFDIIKARYGDAQDRLFLMSSMQLLWDRLEPAGYLSHISKDPLPNTPKHRVLIHYGLADAQVTWLGDQMMGRSVNAHMFESNVVEGNVTLFGFPFHKDNETITDDINFIMGWDFSKPQAPFVNRPASKSTDTHEDTRREKTAMAQSFRFLSEGVITNTCSGPCRNVSI